MNIPRRAPGAYLHGKYDYPSKQYLSMTAICSSCIIFCSYLCSVISSSTVNRFSKLFFPLLTKSGSNDQIPKTIEGNPQFYMHTYHTLKIFIYFPSYLGISIWKLRSYAIELMTEHYSVTRNTFFVGF